MFVLSLLAMILLLRKSSAQARIEGRVLFDGRDDDLVATGGLGQQKACELLYTIFKGDRGTISCATSSLALLSWRCCSPLELFAITPSPRT